MKISKKVGDASIRVLETLKLLSQDSLSIKEIINYFEKTDPNNKIYTNEVILKYINTLKVCGFVFVREKDKYNLLNPPVRFDLPEEDIKAISIIESLAENFPEEKVKKEVKMFLRDLKRRLNDRTQNVLLNIPKNDFIKINLNYNKYKEKIKKYEKYCLDEQKLKIIYFDEAKNKISLMCQPDELKYKDDKVFFSVYNPVKAQIEDINLDNIIEVEQLPLKANSQKIPSSVTFKLKNRLANAYNLHEGERLQDKSDDFIIVVNQFEDRHLLLKRLMRYGENCEVIYPKTCKEEMIKLIKDTLSLY